VILNDVNAAYERPDFAAEMAKIENPLDALQFAIGVQETIARRHGLNYAEFTVALREAKRDPRVTAQLQRVKLNILVNQKWKLRDRELPDESTSNVPGD
jgi:hypothetical protein